MFDWIDFGLIFHRQRRQPHRLRRVAHVTLIRTDRLRRAQTIAVLERQMRDAAANLEFELAAMLRDQVNELRALDAPEVERGEAPTATATRSPMRRRRA